MPYRIRNLINGELYPGEFSSIVEAKEGISSLVQFDNECIIAEWPGFAGSGLTCEEEYSIVNSQGVLND
jgi:hypothetical protein